MLLNLAITKKKKSKIGLSNKKGFLTQALQNKSKKIFKDLSEKIQRKLIQKYFPITSQSVERTHQNN